MILRNTRNLNGFKIQATDGQLGTANKLYFDDETWTIRYLTIDTGGWLSGRHILVSPIAITRVDWEAEQVDVALTKDQVKNSPDINTQKPVSRQHETAFMGYYGYPNYWGGPYLFGPAYSPSDSAMIMPRLDEIESTRTDSADSHLRSTGEVTGYDIQATDGEIGHVTGFLIDESNWAIRYLEVATRNWWPGKKVLIGPKWISRVSWPASKVYVTVTRDLIQSSPEYIESKPITREYEDKLHSHYGISPYWGHETQGESYFALSGRQNKPL